MLTHLDLFSGIGGFALAARWAGFQTIGFVEIDPYCQRVLGKHFPGIQIVGDIRDVKRETFYPYAIGNTEGSALRKEGNEGGADCKQDNRNIVGDDIGNVCKTQPSAGNPNTGNPITIITGGFPCQPFSVAGKRRGKTDDRFLWPEMLRIIKEYKPTWVLGENVTGIVRMALDDCLSDLESIGYEVQPLIIPACSVNAPHRRDRVWIVGYSASIGRKAGSINKQRRQVLCSSVGETKKGKQAGNRRKLRAGEGSNSKDVANPPLCIGDVDEFNGGHGETAPQAVLGNGDGISRGSTWWSVEPSVGRVAHGVPNRVDRLKCLGNAIVPQVAYQILGRIAKLEVDM